MAPTATAGKVVPGFELSGIDGARYNLEQALGQGSVLLAFFKVSCPTCQFAFPFIERIHQQLRSYGAQVWGMSQDTAADSKRFAQEFGISFPILIDAKPYEVSRSYHVQYTPTLFLVEAGKQIALSSDGFTKRDLIEIGRRLAQHYSAAPPPLFEANERVPEYKPG